MQSKSNRFPKWNGNDSGELDTYKWIIIFRLELQEHLMVLKIKQHMEENLQDSLFLDLEILAVVLIGKILLEVIGYQGGANRGF